MLTFGNEEIGGLDIAMNNTLRVRGIKRIGNFNAECKKLIEFQGAAADEVLECGAIQKFHHEERFLFVFGNFMDGADVGVIEGRGGARFTSEAFKRLRVTGEMVGKKFQGDGAAEF